MKLSYQKLKKQREDYEGEDDELDALVRKYKRWLRLRRPRRPRVRVPKLARALRRKARAVCSRVRVSFGRVVERLRESRSHMGELFGGNYLFMQVSPASLKCYSDHRRAMHMHANGVHVLNAPRYCIS
ncbi:hypothetical protein QJS04_geneDACA021087 [Acorus gramineus]|uniref:Uncharacterized protein n=1 Tax=Acorus gramineus TaxID=55184 RepID=A0AAV9A2A7_ACOGR|nr:hypothetical protein QJS04_geneDACA021087 [Acorus gramineus]